MKALGLFNVGASLGEVRGRHEFLVVCSERTCREQYGLRNLRRKTRRVAGLWIGETGSELVITMWVGKNLYLSFRFPESKSNGQRVEERLLNHQCSNSLY